MPVRKGENGKWCFGDSCVYDSKKKAEAAQKAAYASGYKSETKKRYFNG